MFEDFVLNILDSKKKLMRIKWSFNMYVLMSRDKANLFCEYLHIFIPSQNNSLNITTCVV